MHMFWSEDFQRLNHFISEKDGVSEVLACISVSRAMLHDAKF